MEDESGVTQGFIDEFHISDIQGEEMEGESGFIRSIIDELWISKGMKWKMKVVLL